MLTELSHASVVGCQVIWGSSGPGWPQLVGSVSAPPLAGSLRRVLMAEAQEKWREYARFAEAWAWNCNIHCVVLAKPSRKMTPDSRVGRFHFLLEKLKSHIGKDVGTGRNGCFSVYTII